MSGTNSFHSHSSSELSNKDMRLTTSVYGNTLILRVLKSTSQELVTNTSRDICKGFSAIS